MPRLAPVTTATRVAVSATGRTLTGARRITSVPEVRGVELAVSDSGTGVPLFWRHGFASSRAHDTRGALLDFAELARRNRVVRWDARGHGGSGGGLDPAE